MARRRHKKRAAPQIVLILRAKSDYVPGTLARGSPHMLLEILSYYCYRTSNARSTASDITNQVSSPLVAGRCSGKPKGHRSKILPQQIGAIRGTPIPNYQELRMAGPTSEPITPLNRVTGSNNNNNDHSPSLQDQILNHISSLKTLIKEHNKKAGTLITPIRLTFGDEGG
ncbi:hypothetical protein Tco_0947455 [Tanacetum coccineum]